MKTKAEIVQRLLGEGKIDAEEAVVLLMGEKTEIQFIPYVPHNPYPYYPIGPIWVGGPTRIDTPIFQLPSTICQA